MAEHRTVAPVVAGSSPVIHPNPGRAGLDARRAKIVCTLGPATHDEPALQALVDAGMDVARLNLSHGTHAEHTQRAERARRAAHARGRALAVLADLQGPRIRLGSFSGGEAFVATGDELELTAEPVEGDARRVSTTYPDLARDVRPGQALAIDDGRVRLEALATDGVRLRTRVVQGGRLADHKGINLPGVAVSAPALGAKDLADLRFVLGLGVDLVALSFVRSPEDAARARAVMADVGRVIPLIAKIERAEAVERLAEVIDAFDGIMVARGDLGVELPLEQVPLVQKRAIRMCRAAAKPVIVATQMLESMVQAGQPTRAEVSDVANAVLDGADALMLSAETSVGAHAAATVATMARIITAAEQADLGAADVLESPGAAPQDALAAAAVALADRVGARALAGFTVSGATARWLARHRPHRPLLAFVSDPALRDRLALTWGVQAFVVPEVPDTDAMVRQVEQAVLESGLASAGDSVVIVAGTPPGTVGSTNTIRVHRLGAEAASRSPSP